MSRRNLGQLGINGSGQPRIPRNPRKIGLVIGDLADAVGNPLGEIEGRALRANKLVHARIMNSTLFFGCCYDCGRIFNVRINGPYLRCCAWISARKSSDVPSTGIFPVAITFSANAGLRTTCCTSLSSRSAMGFGVPAGTTIASHGVCANPG